MILTIMYFEPLEMCIGIALKDKQSIGYVYRLGVFSCVDVSVMTKPIL